MRMTTKGKFAVTAMIDLALRSASEPVSLAAISFRQKISLSYLEQLFGKLRRNGLVQSVRGPGVFECVVFHVLDDWPRGAGPASYKRNVAPPAPLVAAAKALLDHVDYNGPSGISFMVRDGRYYPHDANLRLGASSPASPHAGFDFPRRAAEAVLELDGEPFSGRWRPGRFMRLDLELEALADAWRTRHEDGAPGAVLRRILSVGFSRDGMLDPSPLDPFWVGQLIARAGRMARRKSRSALRSRGKGD